MESTTKALASYDDIVPKYSLWRVGDSKRVYILLGTYMGWGVIGKVPTSVQLLDVVKEEAFHRHWCEFIDDINAGRLVRIIQQ